jgi:hypothetical protein
MDQAPRTDGAMTARKLDIVFWNYDRTRLLADGTVKIDCARA